MFISLLMTLSGGFAPARFADPHLSAMPIGRQAINKSKRTPTNLKDLINRLRASGEKVGHAGRVSQPFFSVKGQGITIRGEQVQVFEYASAKAAEREAKSVSGSGSSAGTSMPLWVAPPHFYKNRRLIVLYVGENSAVIKALERILGPQFAGKVANNGSPL
jgi:hypothetical protein